MMMMMVVVVVVVIVIVMVMEMVMVMMMMVIMIMIIAMMARFAVNDFTLDPDKIRDNRVHITNFDVNKVTIRCR